MSSPLTVPYAVGLVALLAAIALVAVTPETREARTPRPAYRPQSVSVPAAARAEYFGAALGAGVGFAAFGLFTSLAPTFLADSLHHPSKALAGATAFIVFASAAVIQVVLARRPRRELVLNGTAGALAGLAMVVLALWLPTPSLALFLIGGVAFGAGAGSVFKGAVATVVAVAEPARRAEALAGLFLAGYIGLAVPVVGLGLLTPAGRAQGRAADLRRRPRRAARRRTVVDARRCRAGSAWRSPRTADVGRAALDDGPAVLDDHGVQRALERREALRLERLIDAIGRDQRDPFVRGVGPHPRVGAMLDPRVVVAAVA